MIRLDKVHIEEVRGIRKLDIDFGTKTFAISGPNGSGKSGIIDAIEFGLTGQIGRLTGRGTKGLSVSEHGPHVDKVKFPDAAFVELVVTLPSLKKTATITRKLSAPKKPKIVPSDDDIKAVLDELSEHPEITLSRRDILQFILSEPARRSEEIQTLLKLEEVGQLRNAFNTAYNRLQSEVKSADAKVLERRAQLQLHLQVPASFRVADVLAAVNPRRELLGLLKLENLTPETNLDVGLIGNEKLSDFNKQSALRDLKAVSDLIQALPNYAQEDVSGIVHPEA